tara:strand:+ start:56 stop:403 length:348 start_codon:yes stop_codon:yes gene_type:complete
MRTLLIGRKFADLSRKPVAFMGPCWYAFMDEREARTLTATHVVKERPEVSGWVDPNGMFTGCYHARGMGTPYPTGETQSQKADFTGIDFRRMNSTKKRSPRGLGNRYGLLNITQL